MPERTSPDPARAQVAPKPLAVVYDPVEWGLRSRFGGRYRRTPEAFLYEHEETPRPLQIGEDIEFVLAGYRFRQGWLQTAANLRGPDNRVLLMLTALLYQRLTDEEQQTAQFLAALRFPDSGWTPLDVCLSGVDTSREALSDLPSR